jgi:branched-chain amino acid transport system substrate-binding protein
MMAEAIEKAGTAETKKLAATLRGMSFDTVLGPATIRDFDGQATFGYYAGFTYTHPDYPFKRLKDVTRAEGEDVLLTKTEIEKAREAYHKQGN